MILESRLRQMPASGGEHPLVHLVRLKSKEAESFQPNPALPGSLRSRLRAMGVTGLWSHQIKALDAVRSGRDVIVSTGTASGKSLCFNLPVFEKILQEPATRALYLYPTKALAQDQLRAIRGYGLPQVTAATYDGDTPSDERTAVRKYARIVLSNPDMMHFGILPQHARWAEFFAGLRYVVVDEAHVLRGIFGSHVGCILRRLRRIARHYGSDPTFILTSATIGNPSHLAERLLGKDVDEIDEDGSPKGERLFAFWNPPMVDEAKGVRASANFETAKLMAELTSIGIRTLAFTRSRKAAELVAKHASSLTTDEVSARIKPYRAGYLASERREIEKALFSGELLGVAATSALELGIDVGGLDAVILNGFPGTVSALWQRAGRAGRERQESLAVLVGHDDPLDQYYMAHPEVLLEKPYEVALVDTTNPNIVRPHIACAAYELPLQAEEVEETFGESTSLVADQMVADGDIAPRSRRRIDPPRLHWVRRTPPGRELDIRSLGGGTYSIVEHETGALLGTVDGARAFQQVHPGAVYLHQGENYEVVDLDLSGRVALVRAATVDYYTQSRERSDVTIIGTTAHRRVRGTDFYLGRVQVTEQVVAYVKRSIATGETLAVVDLNLPPQVLVTVAFWYTVSSQTIGRASISNLELPGALHAAEHAAIGLLPMFAMADRWDIGGLSTAHAADTGMPTVFIYDGYPGGVGIADRGFAQADEHLSATLEAVARCPCEKGCPSCVQSPKCGNGNEPLDKDAAIRLMSTILTGSPSSGRRYPRTR